MSKVFLCHASEDKPIVEPIQVALAMARHTVFYDADSLPAGGDYHERIHKAIQACDVFVFIASAASLAQGKYTLAELKFAQERWSNPTNRVLTVIIPGKIHARDLPAYLSAVTVLEVRGNAAAEVRAAVAKLVSPRRKHRFLIASAAVVLLLLAGSVLLWSRLLSPSRAPAAAVASTPAPTPSLPSPTSKSQACAAAPKGTADVIQIMTFIKSEIAQQRYGAAVSCFSALKSANQSGVGYSVYPLLSLAADRSGQVPLAKSILNDIRIRVESDRNNGYGYLYRSDDISRVRESMRRIVDQMSSEDARKAGSDLISYLQKEAEARHDLETSVRCTQKELRAGVDIIMLGKHIDDAVAAGDYTEAAACHSHLIGLNKSGVGYSYLPHIALAYEKLGRPGDAKKVIRELVMAVKRDKVTGYGYFANSEQRRWIAQALRRDASQISDGTVKEAINEALTKLN